MKHTHKLKNNPNEIYRQCLHIVSGMIILVLLEFFSQNIIATFLFMLLTVGYLISLYSKKNEIPIISKMLDILDRDENRRKNPGKGALTLTAGFFLALFLFDNDVAKASIIITTFGDSISHLVGFYLGRIKYIYNNEKNIEGTIAGIIIATIISMIYIPFFIALIASAVSMLFESIKIPWLDDNISIPVISGVIISIIIA